MPSVLDPTTVVANAVAQLLNSDQVLSPYNWQIWESDTDVVLPRGHINVTALTTLVDPIAPMQFDIELVFEGKPKRGSPATAMAEALAVIRSPNLATVLESMIDDGSVTFAERAAESVKMTSQIVGDVRRRSIAFVLFGNWNVYSQ